MRPSFRSQIQKVFCAREYSGQKFDTREFQGRLNSQPFVVYRNDNRLLWVNRAGLTPHEAGLPFAAIKINEHTKVIEAGGDYRKVNPLGYVPALVLYDGTLLTEGAAIVQYIADQVPSKNLAPPNGTIERTRLQAWLNFFSSKMHKGGFSPLF